jgi:thiol-disulfide isomerase/thioredoxin
VKVRIVQALMAICLLSTFACAAADSDFHDIDGKSRHPLDQNSVLIFFWHDCPVCNSYVPEINRLASSHTNFSFFIIQVDPDLTPAAARKHALEFSLRPPVILDGSHDLVRLAKATVTPEAVVLGTNKAVLYRGRIDNLYPSLGRRRAEPTVRDLAEALDAIAAGKPVKAQESPVGCLIQDR